MTPEQAAGLAQFLLPQVEEEAQITRKVLAGVPDDERANYKPSDKCKTGLELSRHIAVVDVWFLNSIADGKFAMEGDESTVPGTETASNIVKFYDEQMAPAIARVKQLTPEQLAKNIDFYGAFNLPAVAYLQFLLKHGVHHRGQLSAYLRPMGSKVPSIYGGSADEPFQMAAGQ